MGWQDDARPITWTRILGTITAGGTAQAIALGAGPIRSFYLLNPSTATSESLWFEPSPDENGPAIISECMEIQAGGTLYFGPGQMINNPNPSIIATTTGHAYVVYVGR
jgi:hypothetical protein